MQSVRRFILLFWVLVLTGGCTFSALSPLARVQRHVTRINDKGDTVISIAGGTGFFVNDSGVFVTAAHVIEDAEKIFVYLSDRPLTARRADLLAADYDADIAVLHVPRVESTPFVFCDDLRPGAYVTAYAWRYGTTERTSGYLLYSRVAGVWWAELMVGPGFSGGPIIDAGNRCVVGVTTHSNNRTFDARARLVRPTYSSEIFDVLQQVAPESVAGL